METMLVSLETLWLFNSLDAQNRVPSLTRCCCPGVTTPQRSHLSSETAGSVCGLGKKGTKVPTLLLSVSPLLYSQHTPAPTFTL